LHLLKGLRKTVVGIAIRDGFGIDSTSWQPIAARSGRVLPNQFKEQKIRHGAD